MGCVMRTCTQGALKRPWALLYNRFAVGKMRDADVHPGCAKATLGFVV